MTNPQHIEALTAEQIATYRERMENPRPGGNAGLPETIDVPTFLATLDRMLATERQKVLDERDDLNDALLDALTVNSTIEISSYGEDDGEGFDYYGIVAHPKDEFPKNAANPYCSTVLEALDDLASRVLSAKNQTEGENDA